MRDGTVLDVDAFTPADAAWLLRWLLRDLAPAAHARAALDEALTTPSAMVTAMRSLGLPFVADVDPAEWVVGTPLARRLLLLASGEGPGRP